MCGFIFIYQKSLDKTINMVYPNCTRTHNTAERGDKMLRLDYKDSKSLHEQIEDGFKNLIINKILAENEQLPSVRELSLTLTVNPNTVQKAYKELENDGFIYSIKGKGNFVAPVSFTKDSKKINELYENLESSIKALIYLGEDEEKIDSFIKKIKEDM